MEDMETTYGEIQEYCLLSIEAAQEARILQGSEINVSANGKTELRDRHKTYSRLLRRCNDFQQSLISQVYAWKKRALSYVVLTATLFGFTPSVYEDPYMNYIV